MSIASAGPAAAARTRDVSVDAGQIRWLDVQRHSGENIGSIAKHVNHFAVVASRKRCR